MARRKLYFKTIDDTICSPLDSHLADAKADGLAEITLIEAVPDFDNPDFVFCGHYGEVLERSICKKSECLYYASKSNRGTCWHRGKLYSHGEELTFNVY
jgi:hypothetical protein